jgi:hypothetical protein
MMALLSRNLVEFWRKIIATSELWLSSEPEERDSRLPSHKKCNKMQQCIKIFISYLYEAQHVSGDTPPIIRSLKLR